MNTFERKEIRKRAQSNLFKKDLHLILRNNLENLLTDIKEYDTTHILCDRLHA